MKAKLNGEVVDALMLNCVEAFGVECGLLRAIGVAEEDELSESGEAYVVRVDDDDDAESYDEMAALAAQAKVSLPPLAELRKWAGVVDGKVIYHLDRDDDGFPMAVFDCVEPLPAWLALTDEDELVAFEDCRGESVEEMRRHWRDFILPIPPPPKKAGDELYLTLAYEFYDAIKAGTKRTEYRDYTPNWVKKILSRPIRRVKFQRGYGGPGHAAPEQMVWTVERVSLCEMETGTKGDPRNPPEGILPDAIAIDLGERVS